MIQIAFIHNYNDNNANNVLIILMSNSHSSDEKHVSKKLKAFLKCPPEANAQICRIQE